MSVIDTNAKELLYDLKVYKDFYDKVDIIKKDYNNTFEKFEENPVFRKDRDELSDELVYYMKEYNSLKSEINELFKKLKKEDIPRSMKALYDALEEYKKN